MNPIMEDWSDIHKEYSALVCPSCGGCYLHPFKLSNSDYDFHDSWAEGAIAIGDDAPIRFNGPYDDNGVGVYFFCENCNVISVLEVYFHKGITFVSHNRIGERIDWDRSHGKLVWFRDKEPEVQKRYGLTKTERLCQAATYNSQNETVVLREWPPSAKNGAPNAT